MVQKTATKIKRSDLTKAMGGHPGLGGLSLAIGLACFPVSAQKGVDSFRFGPQLFRIYSPPPAKPHPFDRAQPLEARARSYLDANCSHCHQPGVIERGGLDLRFYTPLERTALLARGGRPGPDGGALFHVLPGNAKASEIYLRLASTGRDAMPPLGRTQVDEPGLALIREWIESLSADPRSQPASLLEKISLPIHYRQNPTLEIARTELKSEGIPAFKILDAMGGQAAEVSVSANDHPARPGWTLRFSRPLPRGRYWMEVKWDGQKAVRDFLVL